MLTMDLKLNKVCQQYVLIWSVLLLCFSFFWGGGEIKCLVREQQHGTHAVASGVRRTR